jgi:hypothetical protein
VLDADKGLQLAEVLANCGKEFTYACIRLPLVSIIV